MIVYSQRFSAELAAEPDHSAASAGGGMPKSHAKRPPRGVAWRSRPRDPAPIMKAKSAVQRDAEFRELLTSRGLRVTEQRVELLHELVRVTSPISHPELNERMAKSGLDRATIYRNLLTLAEAGVIVRAQLGDQVWRYELPRTTTSDHAHHPHLVCSECGNVRCLAAGTVKLHGEAAKSQVAEVQLRGRCAECVNA